MGRARNQSTATTQTGFRAVFGERRGNQNALRLQAAQLVDEFNPDKALTDPSSLIDLFALLDQHRCTDEKRTLASSAAWVLTADMDARVQDDMITALTHFGVPDPQRKMPALTLNAFKHTSKALREYDWASAPARGSASMDSISLDGFALAGHLATLHDVLAGQVHKSPQQVLWAQTESPAPAQLVLSYLTVPPEDAAAQLDDVALRKIVRSFTQPAWADAAVPFDSPQARKSALETALTDELLRQGLRMNATNIKAADLSLRQIDDARWRTINNTHQVRREIMPRGTVRWHVDAATGPRAGGSPIPYQSIAVADSFDTAALCLPDRTILANLRNRVAPGVLTPVLEMPDGTDGS